VAKRTRHFAPVTDAEEAEIQREIADDSDAPEATDDDLAQARPFAELFPAVAAKMRKAAGRPKLDDPKLAISIRLDRDVVEKFKATGSGWQGRINDVLKKARIG